MLSFEYVAFTHKRRTVQYRHMGMGIKILCYVIYTKGKCCDDYNFYILREQVRIIHSCLGHIAFHGVKNN